MVTAGLTVEALQDALVKTRSERRLYFYLQHIVWPIIEPRTEFRAGWHLTAMCDHAAAVVNGTIKNLLVTIAPRHTKSIIISVATPSWSWIEHPELRWLFGSFSSDLSLEHAVLSRRVINSERYQQFWGDRFEMQGDQNTKGHQENDKRGYRISTSVGGTVVGRGGDVLVLDDPHNLQEIDSELERKDVISFYTNVWSGRFNDPQTGRQIIVMQRGHEGDLANHVLESAPQDWTHLNLPTEYEPVPFVDLKGDVAILRGSVATEEDRLKFEIQTDEQHGDLLIRNEIKVNPIGWSDPRTTPGELLNPDRFGPDEIAKVKRTMGPQTFATQHQQRPTPAEGGIFKKDKAKIIKVTDLPKLPYSECRGWDQASTAAEPGKDPDYTVGAKLRRYSNGHYIVMHVERGRYEPDQGEKIFLNTAKADGHMCKQREEQEGGSSGKKVIAAHERLLEAFDYEGMPKNTNKVVYSKPFANKWDADEVWLLEGHWNQDYIDEITMFPQGRKDDQVDASATAFHELAANPVSQLTAAEVLAIGGRETERRSELPRKQF